MARVVDILLIFFFNDTATTEIYTLSLHDALPISCGMPATTRLRASRSRSCRGRVAAASPVPDRKSTRLNSSHLVISYAVFCLKKKKTKNPDKRETQRAKIHLQYVMAPGYTDPPRC